MNRANRRLEIFCEEEDYLSFKKILSRYVTKNGLMIYHYCIMPNHYHLEAELDSPDRLSSIMAGIDRSYTYYFHKKYETSGYLWQGRFKSKSIQKNMYLLSCGRYIETNPVRAHMVKLASEYPYSSSKHYASGIKDALIIKNPLYEEFGSTEKERQYNYREFLADHYDDQEKINQVFSDYEQPLGDNAFKTKLCKKNGRLYPRRQGHVKR